MKLPFGMGVSEPLIQTSLLGDGPDATMVLQLVRTYAV